MRRQDPPTSNFYGLDFYVDENVLTPRPETEQIVDEVLKLCGKPILPGVKPSKPVLSPENLKILDVGTGSGCIAITLKKLLPSAEIYASDISEKVLEIAQKNAHRHSTPINFIISHLCQKVNNPSGCCPRGVGSERQINLSFAHSPSAVNFDIIVANLPYVDKNWPWLDKESLKQDPDIALYADDGGLKLIKELIDTSTSEYLILEADPSQHNQIIDYAENKYKLLNKSGFILVFISI